MSTSAAELVMEIPSVGQNKTNQSSWGRVPKSRLIWIRTGSTRCSSICLRHRRQSRRVATELQLQSLKHLLGLLVIRMLFEQIEQDAPSLVARPFQSIDAR